MKPNQMKTNQNNMNLIYQVLNYILYKTYVQTELKRLIELLFLQIILAEQTTQTNYIEDAIKTRDNMYRLLIRLRELNIQIDQISKLDNHNIYMLYLLNMSTYSRSIQYSPDQLKKLLIRLKQLIQSIQTNEHIVKRQRI
jgi:hypothetical protein